MRILVTGGAGFIGSHVADAFIAAGHEVAVLDSLVSGSRRKVSPSASLFEVDLRDRMGVARVIAAFRPQVIDHHAAQASVPASMDDPIYDAEINLIGGLNVLRAGLEHGVRKIIFSSTGGALYGDPEHIPCSEDHPIRPLSPYGTSKYCFEQYLATFHRTFGLDYTVLRYANVYGPRQDFESEEGRVIAIFTSRMLLGLPVRIDWDGEQSRDMLYVSDAAAANLAALDRGSGQVYNIGTGVEVTINQIFKLLQGMTGYEQQPRQAPKRDGDVYKIALDCSKAAKDLRWRAEVELDRGLRLTLDYFRDQPGLLASLGVDR
jgi:UDP-glucose 4-epimerase